MICSILLFVFNFLGSDFLAVATYTRACIVEESIDSSTIFNLKFYPLIGFRMGNGDQKVILFYSWERFILFNELLTVS